MAASNDNKSLALYEFKKQVEALKKFRGRGTELVSVYMTPGYPISDITGKLKEEYGQASNIKSASTKKNVQAALDKIMQYLKTFKTTPDMGMAVFAGNVSEVEGRPDVELYSVIPPVPIVTQFYRCESMFVLEPLNELINTTDTYGLVVMDGKEATIAALVGKQIKVIKQIHSTAHSKTHKGGQCLHEKTLVQMADGTIKEIRDVKPGESVLSYNFKKQMIEPAECTNVYARTAPHALRIRTRSPTTELIATNEHRFFCETETGTEEKLACELKKGDLLLLTSKLRITSINPPLTMPRVEAVVSEAGRLILKKVRTTRGLTQQTVAESLGCEQMSISNLETGKRQSIQKLGELVSFYGLPEEFYENVSVRGANLPTNLTPELAQLLGYLIGDGTTERNRITLYEDRLEVANYYREILTENLGVNTSLRERRRSTGFGERYIETRAYSLALTEYLRTNFPEATAKGLARSIPARIMSAPDEIASAFLRGIFDAEGNVSVRGIGLSMINERLVRQIALMLQRFGIVTSVLHKKTRYKPQYTIVFRGRNELEAFKVQIGLTSTEKNAKLERLLEANTSKSQANHAPINGKFTAKLVKNKGLNAIVRARFQPFLSGTRLLGRNYLLELASTLPEENKEMLNQYAESDATIARIESIENAPAEGINFYDLEIPGNENFIAQGIIAHNSSQRYGRLREEGIEYYQKRIGEAMDSFLTYKNMKGVIVGGPGPAKEDFLKEKTYNYQLKILGMVDTSYTDEYGLREVIDKGSDLMKEHEAVVEKQLVDRFIKEVVTNGLATYGYRQVKKTLESGQAERLLLAEDLYLYENKLVCANCNNEKTLMSDEDNDEEECECGGKLKTKESNNLADELQKIAETAGIPIDRVSIETAEGSTFKGTFGGIGAFLRYK
ncbi:hypothetical protein AUJ14_00600 [Candidatus Micrarchaeota archaeon CG1_02_55_22]|nr:MAG: hypothetical protein AUJ14_00600 [Candidatus Micrarchaeota archaeon CG1_02_55_22]